MHGESECRGFEQISAAFLAKHLFQESQFINVDGKSMLLGSFFIETVTGI